MRRILSYIKKIIKHIWLQNKFKNSKIMSLNINKDVIIGKKCLIGKKVEIGSNVMVGDYTYFNSNKNWSTIESNVKIGKFCSIAPGVNIALGNHNYKYVSTHPFLYEKKYGFIKENIKNDNEELDTIIKNDVWIGANANIKRGIVIGNGAVIGMNSVVTKNVPDYAIVAGVPAKIIGYRFSKQQIDELLKSEWWNYKEEKLIKKISQFYSIGEFEKNI